MKADLVLFSNYIYPGKGKSTFAGGIAIKEDTILAIGTRQEINEYLSGKTKVYEYDNYLILPGLIDSHVHLLTGITTKMSNELQLYDTRSKQECLEIVSKYIDDNPDCSLVYGNGWIITNWIDEEWPRKEDLDAISTEIPICLATADGWSCWVNSKALELFGFTKENVPPEREKFIHKDENGELTGILYAEGCEPTYYVGLELPSEQRLKFLKEIIDEASSYGITSVAELSAEAAEINRELTGYETFRELEDQGDLNLKVFLFPCLGYDETFIKAKEVIKKYTTDHIKVAGMKMYMDGVFDDHTAFMLEDYVDIPGFRSSGIRTEENACKMILAAHENLHLPVRTHALGDAAVNRTLNAIEYAQSKNGDKSLNDCIEHANFIEKEDYQRFKSQATIAAIQPAHQVLYENDEGGEAIFGKEKWKKSFPLKSLIRDDVPYAISTDYPIVGMNPFETIYAGMTRRNNKGTLIGYNLDECCDIYDLLEGYTYRGAISVSKENEIGTLEPGKKADIAVINGPMVNEDADSILTRNVVMTIVDGKIVYTK